MAHQKHFTNGHLGLSGSVRALAREDIEKGDIVCITGYRKKSPIVSLAESRLVKKSTGLLFVSQNKVGSGTGGNFLTYMFFEIGADQNVKPGDAVNLTAKGKWKFKKTKTSKQVGIVVEGIEGELYALVAPQGSY
tara:strand:- start:1230 stop:1634 length:405 start_codon:yes stop_codon:yes gene_type:complete